MLKEKIYLHIPDKKNTYMNANLMPVCLIQDGSTEDDDVADNAETVKDRKCCHQT